MGVVHPLSGPECSSQPTRRAFVRTIGSAVLAASVSPIGHRYEANAGGVSGGPSESRVDETAVARFSTSLNGEQRRLIAFPFDHPRRFQGENNWAIAKPTIGDLSGEQRSLCREIF